MSVYVDHAVYSFGRMKMCHMIADTHEELVEMARTIGVAVFHIQKIDTPNEHFDICKSKRAKAIKAGAQPIEPRELVAILRRRRPQ